MRIGDQATGGCARLANERRPLTAAARDRGYSAKAAPTGRAATVTDQGMRRRFSLTVFFGCVHLVVTLGCMMYAMGMISVRFDNPDLPRTLGETIAATGAAILMLPGSLIWNTWASTTLPNTVEWLLFVANSALWGTLGAAVTLTTKPLPPARAQSTR